MSAQLQAPIFIAANQLHRESVQTLTLRTTAAFSAAPSRLLYALTIPEYIETWLTPPDVDEVRCAGNPMNGEALSIEMHQYGRATVSVLAEYKTISAQDLNIRWYFKSQRRIHVSHLRIAIRKERADAVLRIQHLGFIHSDDLCWHQELWRLSLTKMRMLIR